MIQRLASINNYLLATILLLLVACGGGGSTASDDASGNDTGTSSQQDITPDAFMFEDQKGVAINTTVQSQSIAILGINDAAPISITGGKYRINSGDYTDANGSVVEGDSVTLQVESSSVEETTVEAILAIGSVSARFRVTTGKDGSLPRVIEFTAVKDTMPGTVVQSNEVSISGIDKAVDISINNGEFSIDGGPYTSSPGTIANGQRLRVRATSAGEFGQSSSATLTVGKRSALFIITNRISPDLVDLAIAFPPQRSLTDAKSITVRGTASSATKVTSVLVNGVEAKSTDGFATWQAVLNLRDGNNLIEATVKDSLGNTYSSSSTLRKSFLIEGAESLVLSSDGTRIYSAAHTEKGPRVFSMDRLTGEIEFLFSEVFDTQAYVIDLQLDAANNRLLAQYEYWNDLEGTGANRLVEMHLGNNTSKMLFEDPYVNSYSTVFDDLTAIAPFPGRTDSVLVIDERSDEIYSLNLTTGERKIIAKRVNSPRRIMAYPGDNTRILVNNYYGDLVSVDLATGSQTKLPEGKLSFVDVEGLAKYPGDPNRVLLAEGWDNSILSMDLITGTQKTISSSSRGSGITSWEPHEIITHPSVANTIIVSDSRYARLFAVDVNTGNRSVISDDTTGLGPEFEEPVGIIINPADAGKILVVDNELRSIFSVDIVNGNRKTISGFDGTDSMIGEGIPFISPQYISIDPRSNDTILVTDAGNNEVYSVDLATGQRHIFTAKFDENDRFPYITAFQLDSVRNQLFLLDSELGALVTHSLDSGIRRIVASGFYSPRDLVIDNVNQRIYVLTGYPAYIEVISFDGSSRRIVSGAGIGNGRDFHSASAIAADFENNALMVMGGGNIYRIDITSGNRTLVPSSVGPLASWDLAFDSEQNTLTVSSNNRFFDIDVESGETRFFDFGNVTQPSESLFSPVDLLYFEPLQALLVADPGSTTVQVVNAYNGQRTALMVQTDGEDAQPLRASRILAHPSNPDLILVANSDTVYSINVMSGETSTISGHPLFGSNVEELAPLPGDANKILALTSNGRSIAVDLISGDDEELSNGVTSGFGGAMIHPGDDAYLLFTDSRYDRLSVAELGTSNTTIVSDASHGGGTEFHNPTGVSAHPSNSNQVLVVNTGHGSDPFGGGGFVVAVDLSTGNRILVSGKGVGAGPKMIKPMRIEFSPLNPDFIWVSDEHAGIFQIDIKTGDRVILSR